VKKVKIRLFIFSWKKKARIPYISRDKVGVGESCTAFGGNWHGGSRSNETVVTVQKEAKNSERSQAPGH